MRTPGLPSRGRSLSSEAAGQRGLWFRRWEPPLAVVIVAVGVILAWDIPNLFTLGLAVAPAIIGLLGALRSITHGLRPVAASVYTFWFAWLGVGPIVQLTLDTVAWGDISVLSDQSRVQAALLLNVAAIVAFWGGDRMGRIRSSEPPCVERNRAEVRDSGVVVLAFALIVVGAIAIGVTGLSARFQSRSELNAIRVASGIGIEESGGALLALHNTLPSGLAIAVTLLAICRIQLNWSGISRIKLTALVPLFVGIAGVILFANPISQSRFIALTAIGSAVIMILRPRSPRAGFFYVVIALLMTLIVYPLGNLYRYKNSQLEDVTLNTFTSADFDGFQQVINTLAYVEQRGFSFGSELLSALLFFVPRSAWSAKTPPASHEVAEFAGYDYINLSLPLHAEFYMQLGLLGVVLGMAALGFVSARFDNAWLSEPFSKMGLLAPLIAVGMIGLLRGPLLGQLPAFLPAVIFFALCLRWSREHTRTSATILNPTSEMFLASSPAEPVTASRRRVWCQRPS